MAARNPLLASPPYPVDQACKRLGANLRTARIRRSLTIEQVCQKIGTGRRAVLDAERGKITTSLGIYTALMWLYDLLPSFEALANPAEDDQGLSLVSAKERFRVRPSASLDNDF